MRLTIIKDEFLNDTECDERPADYRTEKEKKEDYADYLRDRLMDRQHELAEKDLGAR
ncbi:MAG: hypothetical protein ACYCXQ_00830 [Candidatus Humimicrobiaceae bacterium]